MLQPIIKLKDIAVSFDGEQVLKNFNLTIKAGEKFADLAALYEKALSDKGLAPERTDLNQSKELHTLITVDKETLEVVIQLLHKEGDAETTAVLSWNQKPPKR